MKKLLAFLLFVTTFFVLYKITLSSIKAVNCARYDTTLGCPRFTFLCPEGTVNEGLCCGDLNQCNSPNPTIIGQPDQNTDIDNKVMCEDDKSINTAIGCIPIEDTNAFIGFILGWAIGIGGGIAFLLILVAGFQIMTSSGNPERLKGGQELLTSAIAGLIMLIFSVFILRIIGVDILGLGQFGFGQ